MPLPALAAVAAPAALSVLGSVFRAKDNRFERDAAEATDRNDFALDRFVSGARLLPGISRNQTLDPARNELLAAILEKQFAGRIDPSVLAELRAAGAREGAPDLPDFQAAPRRSFFSDFISAGAPAATAIGESIVRGKASTSFPGPGQALPNRKFD